MSALFMLYFSFIIASSLRAYFRLLLFALVLAFYVNRLLLVGSIKGLTLKRGLRHRQQCSRAFCKVLGIEVEKRGMVPEENQGYLLVSNHRSYLDPVIPSIHAPVMPVGKAELGDWSLLGYGIKLSGVILVQRGNKKSQNATKEAMSEHIEKGHLVLNYPEGTTTNLPTTTNFHLGAFAMAAEQGYPIIPIALDYKNPKDAWIGQDTFFRHFLECFGKPKTYIKISYGPKIVSHNPQELLEKSQAWIDGELLKFRQEW